MQKLLRSRTVWTIVAMFLIGGVSQVQAFIPAGFLPVVEAVLGFAAIYFKTNPSQEY